MERFIYEAIIKHEDDYYYAEVPDLDLCIGGGETFAEAVESISNGAESYLETLVAYGEEFPKPVFGRKTAENEYLVALSVYVDVDLVEGYVTAAEAARELGVTPARVSHLIRDRKLDAYHKGRNTYVTRASLDARLAKA